MRENPHTANPVLADGNGDISSQNLMDIGDNPQGRLQEGVFMENPQRLHVRSHESKLDPQWVVGFVDGEGCFFVGINPHSEMTSKFQILPEFAVVQHLRDVQILYTLKEFFRCGVVRKNHGDRMCYRVRGLEHLKQIIVPFFESHPLKTKKRIDFLKFRQIVMIMEQGEHLKQEGIEKIRLIAREMNRGMGKIKSSSPETEEKN